MRRGNDSKGQGESKVRNGVNLGAYAAGGAMTFAALTGPALPHCDVRPCWTEQKHTAPLSASPDLGVEHQPPVASGGVGGTAVASPPLRVRWNVEGA
jgi:hypothetical protein